MARPYARIEVGMPRHPKLLSVRPAARWAMVELIAYSHEHRLDGVIPRPVWSSTATAGDRKALVAAGLVHVRPDGGVDVHDYLDHQQSAAEIDELSAKRAEAGRRGGSKAPSQRVAMKQASAKQVLEPESSKMQAELRTKNEELKEPPLTPPPVAALPATPSPRQKSKTATPETLPITAAMAGWAAEKCPAVRDLPGETERMLDYHRGKGSKQLDWTATWRTWMGNAQKWASERSVKAHDARYNLTAPDQDPRTEWKRMRS